MSGVIFTLTISGSGISNGSGITQNFVAAVNSLHSHGTIMFTHSATAGSETAFTTDGAAASLDFGGLIGFGDSATADHSAFTNKGAAETGANGGATEFFDNSTAANATFINNGALMSSPEVELTAAMYHSMISPPQPTPPSPIMAARLAEPAVVAPHFSITPARAPNPDRERWHQRRRRRRSFVCQLCHGRHISNRGFRQWPAGH